MTSYGFIHTPRACDTTPPFFLTAGGVSRVVVGLRHPLNHLRSEAILALQAAGVHVDVLRESRCDASLADQEATYAACLAANEVPLALVDHCC